MTLKQTLTSGGVSAVLYTTIDKSGTWSGNLRSVFH
jgi:phosphoribosylformimino-5-aminoimidazole carboxamide ribonucleotide (ProFAR) isomerase